MTYYIKTISFAFIGLILFQGCETKQENIDPIRTFEKRMEEKLYPEVDHIMAKNYPEKTFAYKAYEKALANVKKDISSAGSRNGAWVNQGPGNIGGRINTIGIHPSNSLEMMLGYSSGGIFKTENGGDDWFPVFDQEDITTISDVQYDPNDGNIIYVGTGDLNVTSYTKNGRGVYKSINSGHDWTLIGLEDAGIIAEIGISKANSDIIYAASMGIPFLRTEERGLYKSANGGEDWEKVLYLSPVTGIIDIEVHPEDPNIVYAAASARLSNHEESVYQSEKAGIYKTIDGGDTWTKLTNGLPEGQLGRPGLAMFEGNPDVVYSLFVQGENGSCGPGYQLEGIYKTSDAGDTWTEVPTMQTGLPCHIYWGFGWYFGKIRVNPLDEDMLFVLGIEGWYTEDGGQDWKMATPNWASYIVHADLHDLVFDNEDIYLATDGGAYKTNVNNVFNGWEDIENIVATQFYRVAVSPHIEGSYFGGAQDNGTTGGNEFDINGWPRIFGGDGFQMLFHPTDPNIHYVETQVGGIYITFDGGDSYESATNGLYGSKNWDMQYIMSSEDPSILYTGTDRMFRSDWPFGPWWKEISESMTEVPNTSNGIEHNITTLDESPINSDILYCGVSDGLVWRSLDYGQTWDQINDGLPRRYISSIKASRFEENTVYLTIQGYKENDNTPYIYKSIDNGDNWVSINGDLPQIAINDILLSPTDEEDATIFVGTDGGVYFTRNGGLNWERLGNNMPIFSIYDLAITSDDILVAGSFARGIYTFDLTQLDELNNKDLVVQNDLTIYPTISNNQIKIEWKERIGNLKIAIISGSGKKIFEGKHPNGGQLDIQSLEAGIYFLVSEFGSRKFVKI